MPDILQYLISTATIVLMIILFITLIESLYQHVRSKDIAVMNRKVVDYSDDGWIVLIDVKHRFVGLYYNTHAVSHAHIRLGRDVLDIASQEVSLTIGDFRRIDVEIPRFSYRVLYEYKVPHETRVILY